MVHAPRMHGLFNEEFLKCLISYDMSWWQDSHGIFFYSVIH